MSVLCFKPVKKLEDRHQLDLSVLDSSRKIYGAMCNYYAHIRMCVVVVCCVKPDIVFPCNVSPFLWRFSLLRDAVISFHSYLSYVMTCVINSVYLRFIYECVVF
uniref:Uncharacterized protein n=1 Tax=Spumella elongata TaxID=89044 RepID=A0A7S3HGZ9_9STRA